MPFFTRQTVRRGLLPALLSCFVLVPLLSGCGEDRSNLIPKDTADSLIEKINRAEELGDDNQCFAAATVALSAQKEIENLGGNLDRDLKRSLIDGVVQLQGLYNDQDKCQDRGATTEEPEVTEEETPTETEGTTGETGTTDTEEGTTGAQGTTTDEDQTEKPQGSNGQPKQETPPANNPTTPSNPTTPTNPTTPPSSGPGSGGIGPG
jgi:hypothetical protein